MKRTPILASSLLSLSLLVLVTAHARASSVAEDELFWAEANALSASEMSPTEATPEEMEAALKLEMALHPDMAFSTPQDDPNLPKIQVDVFKTPTGIGIKKEFMVIRVDGIVRSVHVISSAVARDSRGRRHYTIEGNFPLTYLVQAKKPYPFKVSSSYAGSTMYWGLQIQGPYWIHATPHYGQLGRPFSMGCVRLNYPSAMELWDLVVNQNRGKNARITIHNVRNHKIEFAQLKLDAGWVNDRIQADLDDAWAVSRGDYKGYGHARQGEKLDFPNCLSVDCFKFFGKKKPR